MSLQKLLKVIQDNPKLPFEVFPDGVTSADLYVSWISSGVLFNAASMEDDGGQNIMENRKDQQNDHVLCSAALGLERWVRAGSDEISWQGTCLLKPKVTLESVTEGIPRYELEQDVILTK